MYDGTTPLLGQLHEAAKVERDELIKFNLNCCKNEVWDAMRAFEAEPTGDNLVVLNGKWSLGVRLLGFHTAKNDGGSGAGLMEGARLAA